MMQESEIISFLLGLGVLAFVLVNRKQLKRIPFCSLILGSFSAILAAWTFTILEGFFLKDLFNILEHLGHTLSAVLLALWCWKTRAPGKEPL